MRHRLVTLLAAAIAALVVAGCGGGDDSGSGAGPASVAPADAPVFAEVDLRPGSGAEENLDSLAQRIAGVEGLGDLIVEELNEVAAASDSSFDYEEDVEPWLGDRAGLFLGDYDGDDFNAAAFALQSTDAGASEDLIDELAGSDGGSEVRDESYEGVDYKVEEDGEAVGAIDDLFVFAQDEATFKRMVDAADGESLADQEAYSSAVGAVPSGSVGDVFVDIGALIEESGGAIDAETRLFLESAGLEPEQATAVASIVPGADRIEIDLSTDVTEGQEAGADASETLASLPADSVFALATAEFGERLQESIDRLDEEGIPGSIPPNQLKKALKQEAGIDLEELASSIGNLGVFAEGTSEANLTGAVAIEMKGRSEAENTVSNIGLLLRASRTPGVTAIGGKATGFSIRDPELGRQPLVVAARGERLVVGYGLATAKAALAGGAGSTLGDTPLYKEAVAALGETPIGAYADGRRAVRLISNLAGPDDESFQEALPYLEKIAYVAIGGASEGDRATARLIVGIE